MPSTIMYVCLLAPEGLFLSPLARRRSMARLRKGRSPLSPIRYFDFVFDVRRPVH